jgi:hypothetical protein
LQALDFVSHAGVLHINVCPGNVSLRNCLCLLLAYLRLSRVSPRAPE